MRFDDWAHLNGDAYRDEPLEWGALLTIFDAAFGSENRWLPKFPEQVGWVSASWIDSEGVEHEARTLEEIRVAYERYLTYRISFSASTPAIRPSEFSYLPGLNPTQLSLSMQVPPESRGAILNAIETAGFQFLSSDEVLNSARAKRLAGLRASLSEIEASADTRESSRPQTRGRRFEPWLGELFQVEGLDPVLNVVNRGEQIDFTFWAAGVFVIGEARWLRGRVDEKQIRDFAGKLHMRPAFVVGLVISMNGLTQPATKLIRSLTRDRTILTMTRLELEAVLAGTTHLTHWLQAALRERLEHPD